MVDLLFLLLQLLVLALKFLVFFFSVQLFLATQQYN